MSEIGFILSKNMETGKSIMNVEKVGLNLHKNLCKQAAEMV